MISASVELRERSIGRWWAAVVIVFLLQGGLFLWLEDRTPTVSRKPTAAPVFRLGGHRPGPTLLLEDPTLFVLPHRHGFSGPAWLQIPALEFRPADWSEPVQYLTLPVAELGAAFSRFAQTNSPPAFPTIVMPEPQWRVPELASTVPPWTPSALRIRGDLAKRRLLSPPTLPAWPGTDLLTNSVVQLLVDAPGNVVSAVLLPPGSGLRESDRLALELARAARFEPETAGPAQPQDPSAGLTMGTMVFQWQTLPVPSTNVPPATP
jgi:hypothetical protein